MVEIHWIHETTISKSNRYHNWSDKNENSHVSERMFQPGGLKDINTLKSPIFNSQFSISSSQYLTLPILNLQFMCHVKSQIFDAEVPGTRYRWCHPRGKVWPLPKPSSRTSSPARSSKRRASMLVSAMDDHSIGVSKSW